MTEQAEQIKHDEVKLPLIQTGLIGVFVCGLTAVGAGMIMQERDDSFNDGLLTLAATLPGVLIPAIILFVMPAKPAFAWSAPMLAGTMVRALVTLSAGILVYMIAEPDRVVFFSSLLATLVITLVVDVVSVLSLIQKHSPSMPQMATRVDAEGIS